jgi:nucleoside-diphosphate-sugar epimerase
MGRAFYEKYRGGYVIHGIRRSPLPDDPAPVDFMPIRSRGVLPFLHWADTVIFSPAPNRSRDREEREALSVYRETYLGNMAFLIEKIQRKKIRLKRIILIGSTGVYPHGDPGPWSEERPIPVESERQEILIRTEERLVESGIPYVVLRCGGLYGEGRANFSHLSRREKFLTSEMTGERIALVDQEDVCDLIDLAIRQDVRNGIFNAVNGAGVRRRDLYHWAARRFGIPIEEDGPAKPGPDRIIPNDRVKERLNFSFRGETGRPFFDEGFQEESPA